MLLKGKTALITGAATGIGEGIAQLFREEGAQVVLLDRNAAPGVHVCDVRDPNTIASIVAQSPPIDILINNAGIYPRKAFLEMTEQDWDETQGINLKGVFHMTKAVAPQMVERRAGKIVNISSVTFHLGMANLSHYVAAKGGVIGLTRSLAREMGEHNVYVNCITPGAILVDAEKNVVTPEQAQKFLESQSLKRRLLPIDIARVCLFLASELSDGMTGQTLNVDGGWVMY